MWNFRSKCYNVTNLFPSQDLKCEWFDIRHKLKKKNVFYLIENDENKDKSHVKYVFSYKNHLSFFLLNDDDVDEGG